MYSMKNGPYAPMESSFRQVRSGFYGIYNHNIGDCSMYVVIDQAMQYLVMLPLTPNFYWTAYRLMQAVSFQRIWLVMPNMDPRMTSDMINLYMNFESQKYEMHIVYPEPIQDALEWNVYSAMLLRSQCTGETTRILGLDLSIHFRSLGAAAPAGRYGIELVNNHGRHLFLNEVSSGTTAEALLENIMDSDKQREYTWLSMPYRFPTYGGLSMYDIVYGDSYLKGDVYARFREQFRYRLVPYNFTCTEELQEAREKANTAKPYINIPARIVL